MTAKHSHALIYRHVASLDDGLRFIGRLHSKHLALAHIWHDACSRQYSASLLKSQLKNVFCFLFFFNAVVYQTIRYTEKRKHHFVLMQYCCISNNQIYHASVTSQKSENVCKWTSTCKPSVSHQKLLFGGASGHLERVQHSNMCGGRLTRIFI